MIRGSVWQHIVFEGETIRRHGSGDGIGGLVTESKSGYKGEMNV